jgi:ABC-type glycerol-3-phosphate transport system substrate-binding protein
MISRIKQNWAFIFLILLIFIYLLLNVFVFNRHSSKITEIYFADRITAAHRILIEKYNKLHEGSVKVIPIDFANFDFSTNERKEILARSLRGRGDGIDLFAVDLIWVQRFAKWCEPLDHYFSKEEKSRIWKEALKSCYCDGELVAVPLDLVQGIMYYRADIIERLKNGKEIEEKLSRNITWSEFIKLKKEISLPNPFYIFAATDFEGLICSYMEVLLSIKPDYFETYGFSFNTPEAKKALQLMVDFIHKDNISPAAVTNLTEIQSYEYFIRNDGIFVRGWPSYDKDFKDTPFDSVKEKKLKRAPLPYCDGGKPSSIFGGWNLMVSKFSDKKAQVIEFVKFLLSDESQETFFKESGYYPIINSFYKDTIYQKKYPQIKEFKEFMKAGVHRPANVDYTKYSKIMSFYFEQALKNQISVPEALDKATNAIQNEKVVIKEY